MSKKQQKYTIDTKNISKQLENINNSVKELKDKWSLNLSIVAIIISFLSFILVALPSSPKVYFYGDSLSFNGSKYCVPMINNIGESFGVGFVNTGKDTTKIYFYIDGENIQIKESRTIRGGERFPYENDLTFQSIILPYDTQRSLSIEYSVKILNESNDQASLNLGYYYETYLFGFIPYRINKHEKISECKYQNNGKDKWLLIY